MVRRGLVALRGWKLLTLGSKTDLESDPFAVLLPDLFPS